ncbi:hypothetical protein ANANG_G00231760 [Anguilla anguilla]|uniref:IPT/TIG domain-containing protein n=1 Tax=Anguilla anguilla TaxID=7936 RepID=A0A9D3M1H8_ANGAN|nr:hypothetical protein ANANG_G00231760 [Anguilla anguilla]
MPGAATAIPLPVPSSPRDAGTDKKIDSTLNVTLYNCSVGREDCSLCKNATPQYQCVWCARTRSCVYSELCLGNDNQDCPSPKITDILPRYGPLKGGISVTIRGSNLGIKKEDIKRISVAGVPCTHQQDRYSVSTSVVCEIGPVDPLILREGEVKWRWREGRQEGQPSLHIQGPPIPWPSSRREASKRRDGDHDNGEGPAHRHQRGPYITVGGVACAVETFGDKITCKTGEYKAMKVPSDPLTVTVKYGKNASMDVPRAFQFWENPKVESHYPRGSFICLTKKCWGKNDTVLQFLSPTINETYENQSFRTFAFLDNARLRAQALRLPPRSRACQQADQERHHRDQHHLRHGPRFRQGDDGQGGAGVRGDAPCLVTTLQDDRLFLDPPYRQPTSRSRRLETRHELRAAGPRDSVREGRVVGGLGSVTRGNTKPLPIIIPAVIFPMLLIIAVSVYCYRRKSQQAEREYEKVKHQLENLRRVCVTAARRNSQVGCPAPIQALPIAPPPSPLRTYSSCMLNF